MLVQGLIVGGLLAQLTVACSGQGNGLSRRSAAQQAPIGDATLTINSIPYSTRAYWMRQANIALGTPCPFAAFGAVVVNHTDTSGLGEVVCTGANSNSKTGNPTLHGMQLFIKTNRPQLLYTCANRRWNR